MGIFLPFISLTTAASIILLFLSLLGLIESQITRRERIDGAEPRATWNERLMFTLRIIPVPEFLKARADDPELFQKVQHAGLLWDGSIYFAFRWAIFWLFSISGFVIGIWRQWDLFSLFLLLVLIVAGIFGPEVWLNRLIEKRQYTIDLSLPDFLDRLSLGLEAGLGFEIALRRTSANFPGLLGDELRRAVRLIDRGYPREQALGEIVQRTPSQDLSAFVAAVNQTDRLGTSLAKTLRIQTGLLRARRRRRAEEASRRLPILIVFPLVFLFLPALMIIFLAPPILHLFFMR